MAAEAVVQPGPLQYALAFLVLLCLLKGLLLQLSKHSIRRCLSKAATAAELGSKYGMKDFLVQSPTSATFFEKQTNVAAINDHQLSKGWLATFNSNETGFIHML